MSATRLDGWQNLLTRMGTRGDPKSHTHMGAPVRLMEQELNFIYRSAGIGRRVVDIPAQEMVRQWVDIEGDAEGLILGEFARLRLKSECLRVLRWSRLHGGAVMVLIVQDGGTLADPLFENAIDHVVSVRVYDRWQAIPEKTSVDLDPASVSFGQPMHYQITPVQGQPFNVHRSRLIVVDGEDIPERERLRNQGWGDSVLQPIYDELRQYADGFHASTAIMRDFITNILTMEGLGTMIAAGQEDLIHKRLEILDMSRSVLNTLLLDAGEQFHRQASSVAGLPDLLDRIMLAMCAATGIPATKLFGRSPAGLNATGDSDIRNFYDDMRAEQEDKLRPVLERIMHLVAISKRGPFRGRPPADLRLEFLPLWQMSETQDAEWRNKMAQTDALYIANGVLDPSEVALSRFGGAAYSMETQLDLDMRGEDAAVRRAEYPAEGE